MQKMISQLIIVLFLIQFGSKVVLGQAAVDSARVTLYCSNLPLRTVLEEISRQSRTRFVFNDRLVESKEVTCNIENVTVEVAIHQVLKNLDIGYRMFPCRTVALFTKIQISGVLVKKKKENEICAPIQPPTLRVKIKPHYPLSAQKEGLEGRVKLDLLVDKNGKVAKAKVTRSAGAALLDSTAVEYSKQLKFYPATQKGQPTDVWLTWNVNYKSQQTSLLESKYIDRIQTLHRLSCEYNDSTRSRILDAIVSTHKVLIDYFLERPNLSYNEVVKEVILDEIYQKWKAYWNDWQLHFVVFQDFLLRYPDSKFSTLVIEELVHHFEQDLSIIKKSAGNDEAQKSKIEHLENRLIDFMKAKYRQTDKEFISDQGENVKLPDLVN
ncbi:MAG: TonB family protein [Candidatus Zhuqueibacterota bacterium]